MKNTQIKVTQNAGTISFNFEEIKEQLSAEMAYYKGMLFTEETKKEAKETVAALRKLKKEVSDRRIEIKKAYLQPYDDFEAKVKELDALINEPIAFISEQVAEFERRRVEEKKKLIGEIYAGIMAEHDFVAEYLPLDRIYDSKWENATTTQKAITEAIADRVERMERDLSTIREMQSEFEDKGLAKYKSTLELADAIAVMNQYQKQKEEIMRREKEREERQMAEEAAKAVPVNDPVPVAPAAAVQEENQSRKASTNAVTYEVIADPFQIAQLESAMREYGIEYRRV